MKCTAIIRTDYRSAKPLRCGKPATYHAAAGAQVNEAWLCEEHMAGYVEACSRFCHRDGWHWPEPIDQEAGNVAVAGTP